MEPSSGSNWRNGECFLSKKEFEYRNWDDAEWDNNLFMRITAETRDVREGAREEVDPFDIGTERVCVTDVFRLYTIEPR